MRSSGSSPSWAPPKVRPRSPPNYSSSCGCVDWVDRSTSTVYTLVNCTNEDQYKYTYDCYPNKVHIPPGFDSWILYYNISCSDRAIYIYIFHDRIYYTQLRAYKHVMNHELPTLIYHTNSMIVWAQAHTINRMVDNNRPKRPTHTHKHGSTNQSKINH